MHGAFYMGAQVNRWLSIIHKAWNQLVEDFESLGTKRGYGHMREEDIRSYLFCKIRDTLQEQGGWVVELHADIPPSKTTRRRTDIVVGLEEDEHWMVGVEVKHNGQRKPLKEDLDKIRSFMRKGWIKAGALAVMTKHWDEWETIFKAWGFPEEYGLESNDKGDNNYWEIRNLKEIQLPNERKKIDSLLFVLRKL